VAYWATLLALLFAGRAAARRPAAPTLTA
jgi:hypothetical protein